MNHKIMTKLQAIILTISIVLSMAAPCFTFAYSVAGSYPYQAEEHTHNQGCYLVPGEKMLDCHVTPHEHEMSCFDEDDNIICGYSDKIIHSHDEMCYDTEGNLVCTLDENEAHIHNEECFTTEEEIVCGGGDRCISYAHR